MLVGGGLFVSAATEADALVARNLLEPRLLLIDHDGAGKERADTLRRLQAHPSLRGVPILLLARDSDIDSFTSAITRGVSAYLVKPTSARELQRVAHRLVDWETDSEHTERRRRVRRPLLMKVEIDITKERRKVPGQLLDVSSTGCRIELTEVLPVEGHVRVILHSHEGSTHVSLGAEVRWARPAAQGELPTAGLRFTGTTALLAGKLLGFATSGTT